MKLILSVREAATILERHLKDTGRIYEDAKVEWVLSKTENYVQTAERDNQDLLTFKFTVKDNDL